VALGEDGAFGTALMGSVYGLGAFFAVPNVRAYPSMPAVQISYYPLRGINYEIVALIY